MVVYISSQILELFYIIRMFSQYSSFWKPWIEISMWNFLTKVKETNKKTIN